MSSERQWNDAIIALLLDSGRRGETWLTIAERLCISYDRVRRKWFALATPADRVIRAAAIRESDPFLSRVRRQPVDTFRDDKLAVMPEAGRAPLPLTWVPQITTLA